MEFELLLGKAVNQKKIKIKIVLLLQLTLCCLFQ